MKRMLIITATILGAAGAAAVPAFAGLAGNPSFSHRLPVHVPSQARLVQFDDHGHMTGEHPATSDDGPSGVPSRTRAPEPGDDNTGVHEQEPGDDNGGAGASTEAGDDRGATVEPGDDRTAPSPADDRTASSSDSGSRHGGHDDQPTTTSGHGGSHG